MTYVVPNAAVNTADIYINIFNALPGNCILLQTDEPRFTIIAATPGYTRLTGVKKENMVGKGLFDVFRSNPDDPDDTGEQNMRNSLIQVLDSKEPHELPLLRYDSEIKNSGFIKRYWHSSNTPVLDAEGNILYIVHATEEVTDKVIAGQIREKLKGLELVYGLFMQLPAVIGIAKGADHTLVLANDSALKLWGKGKEIIGKPLLETVPELKGQGIIEIFDEVRRSGKPYSYSELPITTYRTGQPETRYYDVVYLPYREEDGSKPDGVFTMSFDVTDMVHAKKEIEEAKKEAEKQKRLYDAISGSTPDLIYVFDLDYKFVYANQALLNMWGSTWERSIGKGLLENGYEPWHAEMHEREIDEVVATGKSIRGEVSFPHATLGRRIYDYIFVPVFNEHGKVEAVAGTTRDITELKRAEEALKESEVQLQQKIADRTRELERTVDELKRSNSNLEEFAYAASHDLKEPVRKIHFFGERIKETMHERMTAEERRYFERMEGAAKRMNTLIDDLLSYSQISLRPRSFEEVNMNKLIDQVLEDLDLEIEDKKAIITVDPLFTIRGHFRQLQQAFQNLISNALKYSKPGVVPEIRIGFQKISGKDAGVPLSGDEQNSFYCISITDNGIGFEQADAERIFNVFTRLHGNTEYRGTGIGLSIVRKVIENHKGHIWATSQPGKGSTFQILLPDNL